jgi:hypothetical protein
MALTTEYAAEKFYFAICPASIFIIVALVVALFIQLRSRRQPEFTSFENAFSFYTISILNIGISSSFVIGIFLAIAGLFLTVFSFVSNISALAFLGILMVSSGIGRMIQSIMQRRTVREQITKEPPWSKAISRKKLKITPDSISRLFAYLQNLKVIVGWTFVAGTLVIAWGIVEIPALIIFDDILSISGLSILFFLMAILKIFVGALILIGSMQIMIKPLQTQKFWIEAISER